ncbi:MAG: hypothetical protein AB8G15_19650 [Saprospiraceae bacterium]
MNRNPLEDYKYEHKLELKDLTVQKISCPSCHESVAADNLNIQTNIAKCNSCDVIFSFSKQAEQLSNLHTISQEILQPEGVEISRFREELDISVEQPWGTLEVIFVSLFPLLVLIVMGVFIASSPPTAFHKAQLIIFLLTSFIGYLSYFFIRKRHKIYIHIDNEYLHIERRPKKLIKDKQFAIEDIDQVYIKNVASVNGTKGIGLFMIVNGIEGQKHVELIKYVNSRSKAKYIEQEIERHLGITDRRVPDEDS